jgi:uncharacterized protein (TIGR03437 family)
LVHGQPVITSVVDPYTGGANLCPGSQAIITGSGLGTYPLVTVGGITAYGLIPAAASFGVRITIEIPLDAPLGNNVPVMVTTSLGPSAPFPITLTQFAPVLFGSTSANMISPMHQQSGLPVTAALPAAAGETIAVSAIGLGPTNPAVPDGTPAPAGVSTTTVPVVYLGANPTPGATAGLMPGQIAIYRVIFAVPQGTATGTYPLSLSIGGAPSNSLPLSVGPPPSGPVIASVVDAVTSATALCPGDRVIVNGLNLGASPLVTVGGKTAFVIQAQSVYQITIEIPVDAPQGSSVPVIATTDAGGASAPFPISLGQWAPVLISSASGNVISPMHQSSGAPVTPSNPAVPNETIVFYGIGLGPTNPVVPTGTPAPSNVPTATAPTVKFNQNSLSGATAVLAAGQIGLYQVTFTVPPSPGLGTDSLWLTIGGVTSSNSLTLAVALSDAAPAIDHLANNYSYILQGLPNYGIAQGSIFDIFGTNLSNGNTPLQSVPLSTSLEGVTVDITVSGTVTHAILYYVMPNQIGAILPSATPVGDGTITVNNNQRISAAAPIHVVQSAFGILTLNGAGSGPAAAFDVNDRYLGFTNALNPGDYFILWGTGVGPSSGDETVTQTPVDLSDVPFSIEVGGLPAQLYYHGRSQYPGLDQVIGIVPPGVSPGCWVSVVARSGDMVSNFATLPVAASGRTCSDPSVGVTASQLQTLPGMSAFNVGSLELLKYRNVGPIADEDSATAQFYRTTPAAFASAVQGPSIGSCLVVTGVKDFNTWNYPQSNPLNAGPAVNITGAAGSFAMEYQSSDTSYYAILGGTTPSGLVPNFIPDSGGGTYTFDNGAGGAAVGAFSASLTLGSPLLAWPQGNTLISTPSSPAAVKRTGEFTVFWSNGNANSFVQISSMAISTDPPGVEAYFTCSAPATAGQFTLPASVLLSLPVSDTSMAYGSRTTLQVSQQTFPQPFAAPNLDLALIYAAIQIGSWVLYQ